MSGYPPLALPPMDMSRNRVGGTGLDLAAGGPLAGGLTGAFQPKVIALVNWTSYIKYYLIALVYVVDKPVFFCVM